MDSVVNSSIMRKNNRGLVFKKIVTSSGISRAELSECLNLTKMTISNIVRELLDEKLICESEKKDLGLPHKNPIALTISDCCPKIVGIEIQRNYCSAILCDFNFHVLKKNEVVCDTFNLDFLKKFLCDNISEMLIDGNVLGIGIACVGPLDIENGTILNPPNFGNVKNFNVKRYVEEQFKLPVILQHHYDSAALIESYFGDGNGVNNFVYLGITRGVGMSGVLNERLYSSLLGTTTEIGHVPIKANGRKCRCGGKGCLERYTSTEIVEKELEKLTGQKKKFKEYCEMTDDLIVMNYFKSMMDYLVAGMIGCVNLFRPDLIIVGDRGKYLPDSCIEYLEKGINKSHLYHTWWKVSVRKESIDNAYVQASSVMGIVEAVFRGEFLFGE